MAKFFAFFSLCNPIITDFYEFITFLCFCWHVPFPVSLALPLAAAQGTPRTWDHSPVDVPATVTVTTVLVAGLEKRSPPLTVSCSAKPWSRCCDCSKGAKLLLLLASAVSELSTRSLLSSRSLEDTMSKSPWWFLLIVASLLPWICSGCCKHRWWEFPWIHF